MDHLALRSRNCILKWGSNTTLNSIDSGAAFRPNRIVQGVRSTIGLPLALSGGRKTIATLIELIDDEIIILRYTELYRTARVKASIMGNLYEVVLREQYADQEVINRWNYEMTGTLAAVTGSFALTSAIGAVGDPLPDDIPTDGMIQAIRNIQVPSVLLIELIVREIWDVLDFYTLPFPAGFAGSVSGAGESTVNSIGYRTNRTVANISRGTKRFAGVPSAWVGDTGMITGGATPINALATIMASPLEYDDEGSTITFTPTIVSKLKYHPPSNPTGWAYKYYPDWATQSAHIAQGIIWQSYANIRSQTSRQLGHGS